MGVPSAQVVMVPTVFGFWVLAAGAAGAAGLTAGLVSSQRLVHQSSLIGGFSAGAAAGVDGVAAVSSHRFVHQSPVAGAAWAYRSMSGSSGSGSGA
jgi:hypothetical protein